MDNKKEVFQQDLSKEERPGAVFVIHLLMKDSVELPDKERMTEVVITQ